jgi:uncharacterized membrane protein
LKHTSSVNSRIQSKLERWRAAGIIDATTAERIAEFEAAHERTSGLNWPVFIALLFGGILVAAGVMLFVAAHWDQLSPTARFTLVLGMVVVFHVAGALAAEKFSALATTFHGIGTASLGAAIFLSAQIFNLHEDWATGVLLWALGAAVGYALLRDWVQAAFVAILAPAWLISRWAIATQGLRGGLVALGVGILSLTLCYLGARVGDQASLVRRVLVWIGGIALLPAAIVAVLMAMDEGERMIAPTGGVWFAHLPWASTSTLAITWIVALIAPLALAVALRGAEGLKFAAWEIWAVLLLHTAREASTGAGYNNYQRHFGTTVAMYALLALGSAGIVWWGLNEKRRERVNLGVAAFAISVLFFYFDGFMGKLGRSAGLLVLGVLCLAGGYALEKTRRKLVGRMEAQS